MLGKFVLLYFLLVFVTNFGLAQEQDQSVDVTRRVDCYPEPGATEAACVARGCIYENEANQPSAPVGTPWCYYPTTSGFTKKSENGQNIVLEATTKNPYGDNISPLNVKYRSNGATLLVTIGNDDRYVPPIDIPQAPSTSTETLKFESGIIGFSGIFSFKVSRTNGVSLWDTSIGGMQFADKFIQIATYLPSKNIYGFGDHVHKKIKHNLERYTVWPMFARDIGPDSGSALSTQNLYGVHPFYMCIESDGKAHGVFILNSNAQEVETGPGPHLTYRTIGGRLDLAFFPGPTPEQVIQQYLLHIGKPFLPAYWALGYQLCRWGYTGLDEMKKVVARNQAAGIPLDVPIADIDYMNHYLDFTEGDAWSGFPAYVDQLHAQGLHLILIFDPAIEVDYGSFSRALTANASFISWPSDSLVPHAIQDQYPMAKNTRVMLGNVWPDRNTAFPDFLDPTNKTNLWWAQEFQTLRKVLAFDGMWIDMNEPSNFDTAGYSTKSSAKSRAARDPSVLASSKLACPIDGSDSTLEIPPYQTWAVYLHQGEYLFSKTLCMLGKTTGGQQNFFDTKNLYGWSEARATYRALPKTTGKRGAVISRSTFASSGRYGGHWLGDNTARWEDLQTSVIGIMEFNMFGLPYVGSDICGFNGASNEELCLRWHQFGAFSSFSRDHNSEGQPDQDPAVWPSVAQAARIALTFRYYYIPYLYSLHYSASRYGATVIRPLFFEFPKDGEALEISEQFLWGSALMIAPALYQGQTTVHAYFPADTWYSLQPETYGQRMLSGFNDVSAPLSSLTPVFVRGGYILPRQFPGTTTTASRLSPFEVLIAFKANTASAGDLYYDGGDDLLPNDDIEQHPRLHWQFSFTYSSFGAAFGGNCEGCSTSVKSPTLDTIEILGYPTQPSFDGIKLNGKSVNLDLTKSFYNSTSQQLILSSKGMIDLSANVKKFTLTFVNSA
ncbi:unnamed protein product [Caenorhabditis angaria]|uniref:P-type domain-containing protein n=1 Tax=Caenorhabditis angaria TaxID=860376 RepID=A0A9P1IMR7_9PELO|nr:unnamed protein product [Caenorhabditis angaria]